MPPRTRIHRARPILKRLDAIYQTRAVPPGSVRYWSWFFATPDLRAPLLGIFALGAEWQALMDPATESGVAHLKLAWWRGEILRLIAGSAVHPIGAYLASLPRAAACDFTPLLAAVDAASLHVSGVPWERGTDVEPLSQALWGGPLALASQLACDAADMTGVRRCTGALAAAECLSRAIRGYRRQARVGRVPFAVDELIAAGVENADLLADEPPARLRDYLDRLRARTADYFDAAAQTLPQTQRAPHRHLLVLAALGRDRLQTQSVRPGRRRLKDMLLAWRTARRAYR
jgi:15-cis-phytoene synthase